MLCWLRITRDISQNNQFATISILSRYSHSFTCSSHWPGPSGRPHSWSSDSSFWSESHPAARPMHAPAWANADSTRLGGISQRSASSDLFSLLYYLIVRLRSRSRSSPSFPLQYFRSIFRVCTNTNTNTLHLPLPHHCSSYLSSQMSSGRVCSGHTDKNEH